MTEGASQNIAASQRTFCIGPDSFCASDRMLYGRGSWVRGQFGDSYEYGGGVKWHFLPTERLWLNTELFLAF